MKDVGGRGWWLSGGWLLGVLACVTVAIPVGLLEAGAGPSVDWTRAIVPVGLMISTGGILGVGRGADGRGGAAPAGGGVAGGAGWATGVWGRLAPSLKRGPGGVSPPA